MIFTQCPQPIYEVYNPMCVIATHAGTTNAYTVNNMYMYGILCYKTYNMLQEHYSKIRYQTPPPPPPIKYQISCVRKNQISGSKKLDIRYQTRKNQISDIKVPPFHPPPPPPLLCYKNYLLFCFNLLIVYVILSTTICKTNYKVDRIFHYDIYRNKCNKIIIFN